MSKELQAEVEELASLQFSKDEILTIVGENKELENIWIKRGRLKAEAEVRKAILSQAKQGSSPAQKAYMDMIKSITEYKKPNYPLLKNEIVRIVYGTGKANDLLRRQLFGKLSSLVVHYE